MDFIPRPGDTDNNLLRKILDRLNSGITLFGEQGELPLDVEIVAVANFPVSQQIYGNVGVSGTVSVDNFPAGINVNNFPGGFNVNNFPVIQPVVVTGNPDVHIADAETDKQARVSNFRQLHVESQVRLVGQSFNTGSTLDTNFWTPALTGSGTTTISAGVLRVRTGATADSTSSLSSVRTARHVGSTQNIFRTVVRLSNTGTADNIRRWGCFDSTNGFFFQMNGTTMQVGYRFGGITFTADLGTWNVLNTFVPDINWHAYEVIYSITKAFMFIDDQLVHVFDIIGTPAVLGTTQNHPVRYDNYNSNGSTADLSLYSTHGLVSRLGQLATNNKYANITTATTTVLKYAAGTLGKLIIGNPAGTVTIYDNTSAAGTIITTLDLTGVASATVMSFDVAFNTGLTVVTSSASVNLTVIYE